MKILSKRRHARLCGERFEPRYCLSAVSDSFVEHPVIERPPDSPSDLKTFDLNGDGRLDALAASDIRGTVAWYENLGDVSGFNRQQIISDDLENVKSVYAGDLDGDGDLDVIAASGFGSHPGQIAWYENTDGRGAFGRTQIIATNADDGFGWIYAADMDQDGDLDLLSAPSSNPIRLPNDGWAIAWYENTDGHGTFSSEKIIATSNAVIFSVAVGDVDQDGDLDVVAAHARPSGFSFTDDEIVWYENRDGQGSFAAKRVISTGTGGANSVFLGDVDNDDDLDVLFAPWRGGNAGWYENTDGSGAFGAGRSMSDGLGDATGVSAGDLDRDGDLDIVAVSVNYVMWYENLDGRGGFGNKRLIGGSANAYSLWVDDVDGDGDLDLLTSSPVTQQGFSWHENRDAQGTFGTSRPITSRADDLRSMHTGDLDGDGDLDVLSASAIGYKIAWYENLDGRGSLGLQQVISTNARNAAALSVQAGDVDGDGDLDVLTASKGQNRAPGQIAWLENMDGQASFGEAQIIATPDQPEIIYAADLDGDNDLDVLSRTRDGIEWYENEDGRGSFGPPTDIGIGSGGLHVGDLDGDGDLDIVSAVGGNIDYPSTLLWYENTDGQGDYSESHLISRQPGPIPSVYVGDVDGDRDLDIIAARYSGGIAWFENSDGQGDFGEANSIASLHDVAPNQPTLTASDMDGDGDLDVVSQDANGSGVAWYENISGQGDFGNQQIISIGPHGMVSTGDLDADGDPDVLAGSYGDIVVYENRLGETPELGIFREFGALGDGGSFGVATGDLDADGDVDAVLVGQTPTSNQVYLNNGRGLFADSGQKLGNETGYHVELADVDSDGDLDAWISHGQSGGATPDALWLNDGHGTFQQSEQVLGTVASSGVAFGDIDADGDLDAAVSSIDAVLANQLWLNDGTGNFWLSPESIGTGTSVALQFSDVDGDRDLDLIVANQDESHGLFVNSGQGKFREVSDRLGASSARDVAVGNLDGDGELDIYFANANNPASEIEGDQVHFVRGGRDFWFESSVAMGNTASSAVSLGDLDLDGDTDALVANWFNQPNSVWINVGEGGAGMPVFLESGSGLGDATSAHAALLDMDGDGDLDVIVANVDQPNRVYENTTNVPTFGDANRDGIFNSADLIQVFVAGEYEDGVPKNSTWEDGDWDGDGDFGTGDLILAFQAGHYVATATTLESQIAAAVDWIFSVDEDDAKSSKPRAALVGRERHSVVHDC